jgi:tRNA(fMet)-specific endonuclease VapC
MRRFLLDTGIVGDYVNHRKGVYEHAQEVLATGGRIGISMPVLGELWAGMELSDTRKRNEPRLRAALKALFVWPFDERAAREFGRVFAVLTSKGRPIEQIDMQTAAIALSLGNCTVVTKDKHFAWIPGLDLENWSK